MTAIYSDKSQDKRYDVAISFLAKDEKIAGEIASRLEDSGLNVFFFPRKQENIAGSNGLESMRVPFLTARVAVVLFKEPWGKTPWTRIEEAAISDRCLEYGWSSLIFVQLDKESLLPKWLPHTHIRFALEDYGLDQLVGAIKARVQDHGGEITRPDAMHEARRVKRESEFISKRKYLLNNAAWIENVVHSSLHDMMKEIVRLAIQAKSDVGLSIEVGSEDRMCAMHNGRVSMGVWWRQDTFGNVEKDAYLYVREFSGKLILPGERKFYLREPQVLREHKFEADISATGDLRWRATGGNELLTSQQVADKIMRLFLDLISRANQGKVTPRSL